MTSIDRSLAASGPTRADTRARQAAKPPRRRLSWGDPFTRGLIYQAGLAVLLALGIYALYSNVSENLQRQNIATGFSFLEQLARFNIGESPIPYSASDTYGRALLVGVLNTLRVAAVAIVFATVLGVAAGVARASRNVVISTLAGTYVELARNVPIDRRRRARPRCGRSCRCRPPHRSGSGSRRRHSRRPSPRRRHPSARTSVPRPRSSLARTRPGAGLPDKGQRDDGR